MKTLKSDFLKIIHTDRSLLILIAFNFLLALVLAIFSFVSLNPSSARTKFGYGDIGAYRDGSWADILAFPLLALVFGVLHSFLSLRIFHKRGSSMAQFFLLTTTFLILGSFLVLIRALGEG